MTLAEKVYAAVQKIPRGKVAVYSQIAALCGNRNLRRFVGNALRNYSGGTCVPCHRVVNARGECSGSLAFGGTDAQKNRLLEEGVFFNGNKVDFSRSLLSEDKFQEIAAFLYSLNTQ